MKYLHPDVLDNGPALIKSSAIRALLIPLGTSNYSQAVNTALLTATVSTSDFTLSSEGTGRKLVFGGAVDEATTSIALSNDLHVAFTDGSSRLLWVEGIKPSVVIGGQSYSLPSLSVISPQPTQG